MQWTMFTVSLLKKYFFLYSQMRSSFQVRIYSRNQEDNTSKYPDLVNLMPRVLEGCDVQSCIIDSEAVAWDRAKKQILPFQILSTRKRKVSWTRFFLFFYLVCGTGKNPSWIRIRITCFNFGIADWRVRRWYTAMSRSQKENYAFETILSFERIYT